MALSRAMFALRCESATTPWLILFAFRLLSAAPEPANWFALTTPLNAAFAFNLGILELNRASATVPLASADAFKLVRPLPEPLNAGAETGPVAFTEPVNGP